MNSTNVTIARVYALESHDQLDQVLNTLRNEQKINGVTVLRGIEGQGASGDLHTSSLLDLSLDLPIIIEFYDKPDKVKTAIQALQSKFGLHHIVSWQATVHSGPEAHP